MIEGYDIAFSIPAALTTMGLPIMRSWPNKAVEQTVIRVNGKKIVKTLFLYHGPEPRPILPIRFQAPSATCIFIITTIIDNWNNETYTYFFLLAALLLQQPERQPRRKKPIPIERYQKKHHAHCKTATVYNPAHEYVFMYPPPFKENRGKSRAYSKQGQDLLEHTVRIFPDDNQPRTCKWIYGCMMPTV